MGAPYVVAHDLNLYVYGQVQRDFTLGGVQGYGFGDAANETSFRRAVTFETELDAMNRAAQLRITKLEDLGNAMAIVSGACTKFNKKDGVTQQIEYDYTGLGTLCAKYGITVEGVSIPDSKTSTSYANLQKIQSTVKLALDEEQNALQRHTASMQNVMSKRDSAMEQLTKVAKKFDATANTMIRNIGKGV